MHIATPEDKIIQPKAFKVTLRNGMPFVIGGMSASQLKYLRKNGGLLSLKNNVDGADVNIDGKMIKTIEPFTPPQQKQ